MKTIKNSIKNLMMLSLMMATTLFVACNEDEEPDAGSEDPIASFQFEVSADDWKVVSFSNFSQNATSYSWDFGDGSGTSTDENPTYTYTDAGSYDVELTATNDAGVSASKIETVTITDPLASQRTLVGENGKTWQLLADVSTGEYPYEVGPNDRSQIWWAMGLFDELCVRECIFDDTWTFNTDGTFTFENNDTFWGEGGVWADELVGCFDASSSANFVGPNGEDLSAWDSGTHNFTFDASANTLTVEGNGAFIGLSKVATTEEVATPQSSITYNVVKLVDADVDTLVLETELVAAGGYWSFTLVSYDNEADKIVIDECPAVEAVDVTFEVNMNEYEGSFTTAYVSGSFNGWSGTDDAMTDDDGDGIWTLTKNIAVGAYEFKFTLDDWTVQEEFTEGTECTITKDGFTNRELIVGEDPFTYGPNCFNSCDNCEVTVTEADIQKAWHLPSGPGAVRVGPGIGAGDWFTNDQAWADAGPCLFDDTFTFGTDGKVVVDIKDEMFTEGHMKGIEANGCVAVGDVPSNLQAWTGGTFDYTFTAGTDSSNPTISVSGNGAYVGFYKGANGSEPTEPSDMTITYEIISFTGNTMEISVDISANQDRSAAWTYKLVTE